MSEQDQFLSILREILEQYSMIFKVIHEIDKTIGDGNRELRTQLQELETVLRSQLVSLAETSKLLEKKFEANRAVQESCDKILEHLTDIKIEGHGQCKECQAVAEVVDANNSIISKLQGRIILAGIIVGGICTILGGIGFFAIRLFLDYVFKIKV